MTPKATRILLKRLQKVYTPNENRRERLVPNRHRWEITDGVQMTRVQFARPLDRWPVHGEGKPLEDYGWSEHELCLSARSFPENLEGEKGVWPADLTKRLPVRVMLDSDALAKLRVHLKVMKAERDRAVQLLRTTRKLPTIREQYLATLHADGRVAISIGGIWAEDRIGYGEIREDIDPRTVVPLWIDLERLVELLPHADEGRAVIWWGSSTQPALIEWESPASMGVIVSHLLMPCTTNPDPIREWIKRPDCTGRLMHTREKVSANFSSQAREYIRQLGGAMIKDDRTEEEIAEDRFPLLVVATDRSMSGWGAARNGASWAAWACRREDADRVLSWVESRSEMKRVRVVPARGYKPHGFAHLHIYVVRDGHPSLGT